MDYPWREDNTRSNYWWFFYFSWFFSYGFWEKVGCQEEEINFVSLRVAHLANKERSVTKPRGRGLGQRNVKSVLVLQKHC